MSLWPFSSSTSNIAFGGACETGASMTTACRFWSLLASALRGGAPADALDGGLMVLMSEAGLLVGSMILFGNSLVSQPIVWLVFLVVSLQGAFAAMQTPSLAALPPRLVDRDELAAA